MNNKSLLGIVAVITATVLVWALFLRAPKANGPQIGGDATETAEALVRLLEPAHDDAVTSPLSIRGEARGDWYFEASFPVQLLDANGREIAVTPAQAQGEWMTENFVPFSAVLLFDPPATETGTLVLQKDNPSGLPEFDDEIRIPVRFGQTAEPMAVQAFFGNSDLDPEVADCSKVFSAERTIPKTAAVARAALQELLAGPTPNEAAEGYFSSINPGVEIQDLTVADGVARVDFSPRLDENMGGSCRVAAIRAQITETLKQFPTVENVIISINGETDLILQP